MCMTKQRFAKKSETRSNDAEEMRTICSALGLWELKKKEKRKATRKAEAAASKGYKKSKAIYTYIHLHVHTYVCM